MKEQGIEEIFKSAFNNFETDVDPQVWTNVQSRISGTPSAQSNHSTNGSVAGKAGVVAGKLGVKAIIAIVTTVTGVSVGTYFLLKDTHTEKVIPTTVQSPSPTMPVVNNIPQQQMPASDVQASGSSTTTSALNVSDKILPKQKERAETKSIAASNVNATVQPDLTKGNSATPADNIANVNPPLPKQTTPATTQPAANAIPPVVAKTEEAKPEEGTEASSNHVYQNDFANINDYLNDEASVTKGLPNVFTPNGDGKDDEFKINTKNLKSLMVTVFDRSGKLIYRWNGLDGKWDGNLSDGRPAPVGTYYYSVQAETADGKICIGNSTLTLNR